MISFYGFYTTWTTLLGLLSSVALGFILKGYNQTAQDTCDVNQYNKTYNLYNLNIFLLVVTMVTATFNFVGYSCTHKLESSPARKFIMFLMFVGFIVKCMGIVPILIKFDKDHECFTFYENSSSKCMLITFISMSISQIIEVLMVLLGFIALLCCSENVSFVNSKYNDYQQVNNEKYYN
jgi:hypothetical protein